MRTWWIACVVGLGIGIVAAQPPAKAQEANTRGMQLYAKKDYAHAADEFRAAIKLDDAYVLARYNLASMAALLGDKPTVLEQLRWLRASKDPLAATVLAKAKTDPDLKSVVDDPDVKALVDVPADKSCSATCDAAEQKCAAPCNSRDCVRTCTEKQGPCRDGCAAGMTADGVARMRAWLDTPLTGRDNSVANFRVASISRVREPPADFTYTVYVKNQFEWTCTLAWSSGGNPGKLSDCKSADPKWSSKTKEIALSCEVEKKPKQEVCRGGFVLAGETFADDAEFVLRRPIK
jgi:hypothetical protein